MSTIDQVAIAKDNLAMVTKFLATHHVKLDTINEIVSETYAHVTERIVSGNV